ncbi:MAG: alpha/beta hydrolase [Myxococcota bacterium]
MSTDLRRMAVGEVALAIRQRQTPGTPRLFIHGSLEDHRGWDEVVAALPVDVPWVVYDRRGHGASTNMTGQGRLSQDVEDVARLIEQLGKGPIHVVGHSYGANVAIALAGRFRKGVKSLVLYEPPVFGLLRGVPEVAKPLRAAQRSMGEAKSLIEEGALERGTKHFVEEVAFGTGSWGALLDANARGRMLAHADTWLDQARDPERFDIDVTTLGTLRNASGNSVVTLVSGAASLATFRGVVSQIRSRVPTVRHVEIPGAGHGAPLSHPVEFAAVIEAHVRRLR